MKTAPKALPVRAAKDARLFLKNGKVIIDGISSWWVITHGHCHPKISEAIARQSQILDQVLFANFSHSPSEKLIDLLSQRLPKSLNRFFFSDNGSTAIEVSLKMLLQHWQNQGKGQKNLFLSFDQAYHGDTVGAMSVGGNSCFTQPYKDMLFSVLRVGQGRYSSDTLNKFTDPFFEAFEKFEDRIAGVIIEPLIQGAGGMIVWPKDALERIGKKAKAYGIPLIFDEVMTGFGRTGSFFAFDQLSFDPDILCLSKGLTGGTLPLSLTIVNDKIYQSFLSSKKDKMFFHGHSFTGNPISCAAAVANLEILNENSLVPQWKTLHEIQKSRVQKFRGKENIKDLRLCGTVAAIELDDNNLSYTSSIAEQLTDFGLKRGVFLRPLGNVIYVMPPYSIEPHHLHLIWDVIDEFYHAFLSQEKPFTDSIVI